FCLPPPAPTAIHPLSLHDALPILDRAARSTTADVSSAKHASTKRPVKAGITRTHQQRTQEPAVQAVPVPVGSTSDITAADPTGTDRKSTRLNSSHSQISYAVFCLK